MVIKDDPRRLLNLLGTKHTEKDPDEEFMDRLAKKTSFYDQPSAPPEGLTLPAVGSDALDELADMQVEEESRELLHVVPPPPDAEEAAAERQRRAEQEKKEARYASLFEGRSAGGSDQTGVPENLRFERLSARPDAQRLPNVGTAVSAEEAALRVEDAARRAAWAELNRLREDAAVGGDAYKRAHERFVATWGHRGAELRE